MASSESPTDSTLNIKQLFCQYWTGRGSRLRHKYHVATERHGVHGLAMRRIFNFDTGRPEL